MIVTFFRHGEAGGAAKDSDRALTGQGTDDVGYGAHQLLEHCKQQQLIPPGKIIHSPYLRTTQTAQLIVSRCDFSQLDQSRALLSEAPEAGVDALLESEFDDSAHLVLVSHQPLVSNLIAHYLGSDTVPHLCPAGFCTLRLSSPAAYCARLLFWATPPCYEAQH